MLIRMSEWTRADGAIAPNKPNLESQLCVWSSASTGFARELTLAVFFFYRFRSELWCVSRRDVA